MNHVNSTHPIKTSDVAILFLLSLVALVTRAYGIADWPVFQDELYTILEATERYQSFANPAYYLLVTLSFKIFGVSEWAIRVPCLVLGVLGVPVFYICWRNVIGRQAAAIGALLIVFSAWHLWHSQYARYYAGVFLFASLGYYFYYKAITRGSLADLAWSLVCTAAAAAFHVTAIMVLAGCATYSLVVIASSWHQQQGFSRKVAIIHVTLCVAAGIVALPFLWHIAESWYANPRGWGTGPFTLALKLLRDIQLPIAAAAALGLVIAMQVNRGLASFLSVAILVPLVAFLLGSVVTGIRTDYIFYIYPLVFVLAGLMCEYARQCLSRYHFAAYGLVLFILVNMVPDLVSHYTDKKSLDVRDVVAFVDRNYQEGDRVVSTDGAFRYYFVERHPVEEDLGHTQDNQKDWSVDLNAYKRDAGRVWIVLRNARTPLAKGLEQWLLKNARLVWRKSAVRYDADAQSYEVFLVDGRRE